MPTTKLPPTFADLKLKLMRAEMRCLQDQIALVESTLEGQESIPLSSAGVEWRIQVQGHTFAFRKYVNGCIDEAYGAVEPAVAIAYAEAIIQGFEPPRGLSYRDKQAG